MMNYRINQLLIVFIFILFYGSTVEAQKKISTYKFISEPFPHPANVEAFTSRYHWRTRIDKKPTENIHNGKIDTIYIVKISGSELFFYKTQRRDLFYRAFIKNRRIKLTNDIRVGMKRDEFFDSFSNLKPTDKDKLVISNRDKISKCIFKFKWNRLWEIQFDYYID